MDVDGRRELVAHQRMGNMRHVHTDLVRTSGFQTQPKARVYTEVLHNAVMRHRRFPHGMHGHMRTFGGMTADRLFYSATGCHMTNRYGFVLTRNFTQL